MFRKKQFLKSYSTYRLTILGCLDSFKKILVYDDSEAVILRFLIRNFLGAVKE
jgi:hypothetical protein